MSLSRMLNIVSSKNNIHDKTEFSNDELLAAASIDSVLQRSRVDIEEETYQKHEQLSEYATEELVRRIIKHTNIHNKEDARDTINDATVALMKGMALSLDDKIWNGALSADKMTAQKLLNDEVCAVEERQLEKDSQRIGVNVIREDEREVKLENEHQLRLESRRARELENINRRF